MATLTTQTIVRTGLAPSYAAAAGGGDAMDTGDDMFLHVKNTSGGAITVMPHSIENPDSFTPNGFLRSVGENGLLVSECSPGRTPGRDALHSQQRIIAALSAITTVIESGAQGEAVQSSLRQPPR